MSKDEVKRIMEDMEAQGLPLEVKTSELLKKFNWELTNQVAYLDLEKKKYKSVDIVAQKRILKILKFAFDLWLVIECKKSTKPWVFYATDFNLQSNLQSRKVVSSFQFYVDEHGKYVESILDLMVEGFMLRTHYYSPILGKMAYIPFEAFTKGEGRSIHKAQMQVSNAILDLKRLLPEVQIKFPYGILFLPAIVLEGHLYSYKDGKLNAEKGLYYYTTYANSAFMIEIVTIDFLETYLSAFEQQINRFQRQQ